MNECAGRISLADRYILPSYVSTYRYPSPGPTLISVITPNPCPNITGWSSSRVSAILSESAPLSSKLVLSAFNLKLYRLPVLTSPVKNVLSYCFPSLSEFKNFNAVGPIVCLHTNWGSWYCPCHRRLLRL